MWAHEHKLVLQRTARVFRPDGSVVEVPVRIEATPVMALGGVKNVQSLSSVQPLPSAAPSGAAEQD